MFIIPLKGRYMYLEYNEVYIGNIKVCSQVCPVCTFNADFMTSLNIQTTSLVPHLPKVWDVC